MRLTRIVSWSHVLLTEILKPGDLAVDLTAGSGRDTLMLADAVGASGQVVAFDLQGGALKQTAARLRAAGRAVFLSEGEEPTPDKPGVYLVQTCHSRLQKIVKHQAQAIIANLGYLPGGDPQQLTASATTVAALRQALDLLAAGGRLAVTLYPGHPGGAEEAAAVSALCAALSSADWQVLELKVANCGVAPFLLVAEKARRSGSVDRT